MIRFKCSQCGKTLKAAPELVGRRVKCARCQAVETVPRVSIAKGSQPTKAAGQQLEKSDRSSSAGQQQDESEQSSASNYSTSSNPLTSDTVGDRKFKLKQGLARGRRWWFVLIGTVLGLIVASVVAYVVIKNANATPKFKAEFEAMEEVKFYRRAHGKLEQSRKRLSVMAAIFKAKSSSAGDFSQQHEQLNDSIDVYTSNSNSLLTEAAKLRAQGKDVHAKALLVETGKKMQMLVKEIEREVGEFNKKSRR